ncbi:hypothetical protein [Undibacterium sp. TJN19]|uniref:hypothetical protein n=1 Tax=Undibacterium sp. TJN19 TaxID=3413055 RepID=UPI003BF2DF79
MKNLIFLSLLFVISGHAFSNGEAPANAADLAKKQTKKILKNRTVGPMYLSKSEIDTLMTDALNGNGIAANKLGMYFDVGDRNYEKCLYWLGMSAELGNAVGQYNYGYVLLRTKTKNNVEQALKWLELAQKNGQSYAEDGITSAKEWIEKNKNDFTSIEPAIEKP